MTTWHCPSSSIPVPSYPPIAHFSKGIPISGQGFRWQSEHKQQTLPCSCHPLQESMLNEATQSQGNSGIQGMEEEEKKKKKKKKRACRCRCTGLFMNCVRMRCRCKAKATEAGPPPHIRTSAPTPHACSVDCISICGPQQANLR